MSQDMYDKILNAIAYDADMTAAFKKLWKKYNRYRGAILYAKTPEIHVHYDANEAEG